MKRRVELTVPTSQAEITLRQYQNWITSVKEEDSEYDIKVSMVKSFCGIDEAIIRRMRKSDFDAVVQSLRDVLKAKQTRIDTVEINGKKYGLVPNMDKISVGEFVDVDTYIGKWDNIHIAVNAMYRPIIAMSKGRYKIAEYNAELDPNIYDIPLNAVNGLLVFFYNLSNDLLRITPSYLAKKLVSLPPQQRELFTKNGGGILRFTESLSLTTSVLKQQLSGNYLENLLSSHSKRIKPQQIKRDLRGKEGARHIKA